MSDVAKARIDEALAHPSPWPFTPDLEARYEAAGGRARRRRLRATLLVAAASILAAIPLDPPSGPGDHFSFLAWRGAGALALMMAAFTTWWARTAWRESLLVSLAALAGMVVVERLGERSPVSQAAAVMIAAIALVAGVIASGQVRFTTALTAGAVCAIAFPLIMLAFPGAVPLAGNAPMPGAAILGLSVVCLAARRNEIHRRAEYLHGLRHELVEAELRDLNAELLRLSTTDVLTGLPNRRHFETEARRLWNDREQAPFALAMIDVDHFKMFNDAAGHQAGDRCLTAVAGALAGALRRDRDRVARYGGEEFVALLSGAAREGALEVGERLRRAVEALRIPHPGLPGRTVTVSVGVVRQEGRAGSLDALLGEADRLLYRAKETGRNRVCDGELRGETPAAHSW